MDFLAPFVLAAHMLVGSPDAVSADAGLAELGGRVRSAPNAVLEPAAKTLHVYTENQCVTGMELPPSGRFGFNLAPGSYWLTLDVFGEEVAAEQIDLPPASVWRDLQIPALGEARPGPALGAAPRSTESSSA